MTSLKLKNIPASVRARILNLSRERGRPYNELMQFFMIERFLYRLSISHHQRNFVLKGALLFLAWNFDESRPTMDIDMLGKTRNSIENLVSICAEICQINVEVTDGVEFDSQSIKGEQIQNEAEYRGIRLRFVGRLGGAIVPMQIDVGFGDAIYPLPQKICFPSLLSFPQPQLFGYSPESVIAEKLHAILRHDLANSRLKDFYDIWFLMGQFSFQSDTLQKSIVETFKNRDLRIKKNSLEFFVKLGADPSKIHQWNRFLRKNRLSTESLNFPDVLQEIKAFLNPQIQSIASTDPEKV